MNKIVIAMSGGVDSSAAAVILKRNGYSPVGAMLNLLEKNNKNDIKDAKNICEKLDIQFNLLDKTNEFREKVMQPLDVYKRQIHCRLKHLPKLWKKKYLPYPKNLNCCIFRDECTLFQTFLNDFVQMPM